MKQYTDKDQTAKLLELGFPKPQSIESTDTEFDSAFDEHTIYNMRYSIGELIEFLPKRIDRGLLDIFFGRIAWFIRYEDRHNMPPLMLKQWLTIELIDALFCACVTLKEEGVI